MQNDTQCAVHAYAHTHSLTTKNFLTLSRLAGKLFFKPCLSICRKNSTELLPHSPHFVYETFSEDLNGILNTHIAAKKPTNPNPTHTNTTPPPSLSLSLSLSLSVILVLLGIPEAKPFSHSLSLRVCRQKNKTPQIDRSLNTTMFSGEPKPLRAGVCVEVCGISVSVCAVSVP
jgi:hypothetical protein